MSTQVDLFTNVEPTSVSPAIAKLPVSRSTFYQGDCLVEMDKIADKSVDMILCDLPYGTTACKWDSVIPFEPLWKHYERIIKDNGAIVLFCSEPFSSLLRCSNLKLYKYDWKWIKNRYGNFIMASRQPIKEQEDIAVFSKASASTTGKIKMNYNPIFTEEQKNRTQEHKEKHNNLGKTKVGYNFKRNINEGSFPKNVMKFDFDKYRLHPTQKPIALMEYLIKTYTNEGETVLDNCMGSGTTGVACKKTGRNFIGIEKDEKYFEIAVSRVSAYCG